MNKQLRLCFAALILIAISGGIGFFVYRSVKASSIHTFSFDRASKKKNIVPILIVGSGCAGNAAAIYGARSSIKTIVLSGHQPGGQLSGTTRVDNFPGLFGEMGPDIMKKLEEQARHFGAEYVEDAVKSVDFSSWPYRIVTEEGLEIYALTVIIATGASPRLLNIPGEKEYWGKGVTTCAICDAPFHKGCDVIVSGGGDSAAEEALQLSAYAKSVTIVVRKDQMRASASMQKRLAEVPAISISYNTEIMRIEGNGKEVTGVELKNNKTGETSHKNVSGVFLAIGHEPNTKPFKDFIDLDNQGYIYLKSRLQTTSIPGVYAAGDCEDHVYRQAGVAAGSGIKAALEATSFLVDQLGFNEQIIKKLEPNYLQIDVLKAPQLSAISNMAEFNKLLHGKGTLVIDFYTQYCPSCLKMLPYIQVLAQRYSDTVTVVKCDAGQLGELAKKYNISTVPALVVIKDGKVVRSSRDAMSKQELDQFFAEIQK